MSVCFQVFKFQGPGKSPDFFIPWLIENAEQNLGLTRRETVVYDASNRHNLPLTRRETAVCDGTLEGPLLNFANIPRILGSQLF